MHKVGVLGLYYSSLFPLYWTYRQVKYCFALVLGSVIRHCTHNVLFVIDPCLAGHGRFYVLSPNYGSPEGSPTILNLLTFVFVFVFFIFYFYFPFFKLFFVFVFGYVFFFFFFILVLFSLFIFHFLNRAAVGWAVSYSAFGLFLLNRAVVG